MFNDWFKVGSAYRSGNRTNYIAAIGLANEITPQKCKTTPASVMVTCEGMSFAVGETFASYTKLEKNRLDDLHGDTSYHQKVVSLYLLCNVNVCSGKV